MTHSVLRSARRVCLVHYTDKAFLAQCPGCTSVFTMRFRIQRIELTTRYLDLVGFDARLLCGSRRSSGVGSVG